MAEITNFEAQRKQVAPINKLWWVGLVAGAVATIANLVFFWITKSGFGVPYILPLRGPSSPLVNLPETEIILAHVGPAIGATAILAILGKFLSRPFRVFRIISALLLIISFILPLFLLPSGVATSTKIGLMLMHIIAAAIIVGILTRLGRSSK